MKSFLAVFEREVRERRLVVLAALLLGLTPFIVPFFPGVASTADVRSGVALAVAGLLSAALALALGVSVFARDLTEKRLSFYFSRPLPGWSLWSGKLAAAFLLTVGCGLLVLLPAGLAGDLRPEPLGAILGGGLLASLLLLLAAHAAAVMLRARSSWLVLDFLAALALTALGWVSWTQLRLVLPDNAGIVAGGIGLGLLLALLVASAVQVISGRTDLSRSHRLLSLSLWGIAALCVLSLAGYTRWVLTAGPRDLKTIEGMVAAPAGPWIALTGRTDRGGYYPAFLFDVATGRSVRTGPAAAHQWLAPRFSADGGTAFWTQREIFGRPSETLYRLDLTHPEAKPVALPIQVSPYSPLAISPDGRWLAHYQRGRLTVEDLTTQALLASVPFSGEALEVRLRFLDAGRLRVSTLDHLATAEEQPLRRFAASEVRLLPGAEPELSPIGRIELSSAPTLFWALSPDGEHLLVHTLGAGHGRIALWDIRSSSTVLEIPAWISDYGAFLADGRLAVTLDRPEGVQLSLYGADGTLLQSRSFPGVHSLQLGGQPAPDLLTLAMKRDGAFSTYYLDLHTSALRPVGAGLLPLSAPGDGPGSPNTRLFLSYRDGLLSIAPGSGARRTILVGPALGERTLGFWVG